MTNHYHLLMETPDANLANGMRQLNGVYTQRFNEVHRRCGHVFQGRYKAIIVQQEIDLKELARYIVLNPVRARMGERAEDWPWSSCRATTGEAACPHWLRRDWLLSAFAATEQAAIGSYRRFVAAGMGQPAPWEQLKHQVFLGSEEYVDNLRRRLPKDRDLSEVPRAQRRPLAKPLTEYAALYSDRDEAALIINPSRAVARWERRPRRDWAPVAPRTALPQRWTDLRSRPDEAIVAAYASGGYTLKQIGKYFDLHYSRISRIMRRAKETKGKT
jgi:putative transposase